MAMTISPRLEKRIQRVVESGRYESPEQAIEFAIHRLEAENEILTSWDTAELHALVDEGLKSEEYEALVTPEEARAHLAHVRAELIRG